MATSTSFQIAGILVRAQPDCLHTVARRLAELPGVDVHQRDPSTGRLVVTLETTKVGEQEEGLARIRREPGVLAAEPSYHYVAPDETERDGPPPPKPGVE